MNEQNNQQVKVENEKKEREFKSPSEEYDEKSKAENKAKREAFIFNKFKKSRSFIVNVIGEYFFNIIISTDTMQDSLNKIAEDLKKQEQEIKAKRFAALIKDFDKVKDIYKKRAEQKKAKKEKTEKKKSA